MPKSLTRVADKPQEKNQRRKRPPRGMTWDEFERLHLRKRRIEELIAGLRVRLSETVGQLREGLVIYGGKAKEK